MCPYEELDRLGFALPFGKSANRYSPNSFYSCLQFSNAYRANTLAIFRQRARLQSVAIATRCENPIGARGATRSKNFENISDGATICERRAKKKKKKKTRAHTHINTQTRAYAREKRSTQFVCQFSQSPPISPAGEICVTFELSLLPVIRPDDRKVVLS